RDLAALCVAGGRHRVVMAEQLVGAVDEVNLQARAPGTQYPASPMPPKRSSAFAIDPPIEPMLAKLAEELPPEGPFLYEPKWDGFRAIVFRGGVDVEIVIATAHGLDFDALQMRLHPAASRVAKLAKETPSRFVAFDLLAAGGTDLRDVPQGERRARLEKLL